VAVVTLRLLRDGELLAEVCWSPEPVVASPDPELREELAGAAREYPDASSLAAYLLRQFPRLVAEMASS
jgi:hypothetical protein